jgi:hypothetical protein
MHIAKDITLGYLYFIDNNNPIANSQGKVYVHRHVWFKNTGINPKGLVIHHKDGNKENNDFNNLTSITRSEHAKLHNPVNYINCICLVCEYEFSYPKNSKRIRKFCSPRCSSISKRVISRPSKEEIRNIVKLLGFKGAGAHFKVSDNAVRKWLK